MVKWEYQLENGSFEGSNALTARLNELGYEGWEAVGISADDGDFTVLLKRHKVERLIENVEAESAALQMKVGVALGGMPTPQSNTEG